MKQPNSDILDCMWKPIFPGLQHDQFRTEEYQSTISTNGVFQEFHGYGIHKQALSRLKFSVPTVDDAAEIERFCVEVFPARYDQGWYAFMLSSESIYKLCFRWNGQIIALMVGQTSRKEPNNDNMQTLNGYDTPKEEQVAAYIMLLGVLDPYRKFGLASRLLLNFLRTVNLAYPMISRTFYLHVATDNYPAMRMYGRYGFRRMHILPQYYNYAKDHDVPDLRDAYLYAKEVTPAMECMESVRDCSVSAYTAFVSLFSNMISVLGSPVKAVLRLLNRCLTARLQKVTFRTEPTKVV